MSTVELRLVDAEVPGGDIWLYRAAKAATRPAIRVLWDPDVEGVEHLPADEPFILAANHRSFMDSIFLASVVPAPIRFMAKAEYFDRRRTAWVFRASGQIPVRRGSGKAAVRALSTAKAVLAAGGVIGIYPEGTRSRDGLLHRGNTGVARLALAARVPIVPAGLVGTADVQPPGEVVPRPFRSVTLRFGPPQRVTCGTQTGLRDASDGLMHAIAALCGQPYLDAYAPGAA